MFTEIALDPTTSPFFGAQDWGSGSATAGNGDGSGYFNFQQAGVQSPFGDGSQAIDPQALQAWLGQNGLSLMQRGDGSGEARYLKDAQGQQVGGEQYFRNNQDNGFFNLGAAGILGAGALMAGGLGGAGALGGDGAIADAAFGAGAVEPAAAGISGAGYLPAGAGGAGFGGEAGILGGLGGAAGSGGGMGGILESLGGVGSFLKDNGSLVNLGGNLLSGFMGSNAASNAADAQLAAGREANALYRETRDLARADNAPLLGLRNSVLPKIQGLLQNPNSITQDPGYQFGLDQGSKALQNSATARGMTYSGQQGKALQRYGQDYAGTKLNDSFNRLTAAAGLGQVGANNNQQANQTYSQSVGNNLTDMGNVQGSAYIGSSNAWGNSIGNFLKSQQENDMLDWFKKRGGMGG